MQKYILKGFIKIPSMANNAVNTLSPLGELSDESYSYARDKGFYLDSAKPNVELVSFTSKYREGERVEVPAKYTTHVLTISQWIFEQSISNLISSDSEAFRRLLLAQYVDIADLEIGEMVESNGSWLPSFMQWKLSTTPAEDNQLRVWFANSAFAAQYDDYEIVIVPPVEQVDNFQKIRSEVEEEINAFNLPAHHKKVLACTHAEPYTYLVTNIYHWIDRDDIKFQLETNWTVAIYGIAGNNPAIIKQAVADWILANSAYGKSDWIPIFPDIFTSTEFILVPLWHRHSTVDETARGSLYSPLVSYNGILELAKKYIKYPKAGHVEKYLNISGIQFKSLAMAVCGGNENREQKFSLLDVFPDYALLPTTSVDFNRMSKYTALWVTKLIEATIAAEEMDEYSYVGAGLSRITRDGRLYVAFDYDNLLFLILTRKSMDEAVAKPPAKG